MELMWQIRALEIEKQLEYVQAFQRCGISTFSMNRPIRLILIGTAILAGVAGIGYICLVVLTTSFGEVVAYADQQPSLQIIQDTNSSPQFELDRMLRLAKLHFQNMPDLEQSYWPEPFLIEEHPDCWLVGFRRKTPVYGFLGHHEVVQPTDRAMFLSITKSDYKTRCGKWCR